MSCPYFRHRTTRSCLYPMTESPLPYREDPQSSEGAAGSAAIPASPFRAPGAAQRSDRERALTSSLRTTGVIHKGTRSVSSNRPGLQELVTLGKAVLRLPREKKALLDRV